jgi:transposase
MSDAISDGTGKRRRRVRSAEEKRRIVAETYEAGASVSEVARRHDVNTNLLFTWRRAKGVDPLARAADATGFVPAVISGPAVTAAPPLAKSPAGTMETKWRGGERVIVDHEYRRGGAGRRIEVLSRR